MVGILYLLIGIGVPLYFTLNPVKPVLSTDETILVLAVFVLSVTAGAVFIVTSFNIPVGQSSSRPPGEPQRPVRAATYPQPRQGGIPPPPKPVARPVVDKIIPRPISKPTFAQPKPSPARVETVTTPARTRVSVVSTSADRPDINKLMEDLKNYIKLESWSLALQKANEIIHYYPDAPETETVRDNLSFLSQKVRENR